MNKTTKAMSCILGAFGAITSGVCLSNLKGCSNQSTESKREYVEDLQVEDLQKKSEKVKTDIFGKDNIYLEMKTSILPEYDKFFINPDSATREEIDVCEKIIDEGKKVCSYKYDIEGLCATKLTPTEKRIDGKCMDDYNQEHGDSFDPRGFIAALHDCEYKANPKKFIGRVECSVNRDIKISDCKRPFYDIFIKCKDNVIKNGFKRYTKKH